MKAGASSTARISENKVITAPYTEVLYLSQKQVTNFMKVNPYQVYDKIIGIKLSPSVDKWTETVRYSTEKTTTKVIYSRLTLAQLHAMGGLYHQNNQFFTQKALPSAEVLGFSRNIAALWRLSIGEVENFIMV